MQINKNIILVFIIVLGALAASDVFAAIYKYTDKDGMITFADDLQTIPEQYRASAILVSGEVAEEKKPVLPSRVPGQLEAKQTITAPRAQEPIEAKVFENKTGLFSSRFIISLIVVVSALFSFVVLGMFDEDHKKSIKIAKVVILWVVSVYVLYAHAMDVVHLFNRATGKIEAIQEESAEKGRKTVRKMKEYNAAIEELGGTGIVQEPDSEKKESR